MIRVNGLDYVYKNSQKHAVKDISFHVDEGEIFGFLGPSGAGKSTTQKVLIKLLDGYTGDVKIFGQDLLKMDSSYYEQIGVGFELPNHFNKLTGLENLKFFNSLYKKGHKNLSGLLESVGLKDFKDERVENYSKGMKMRLNFIRALLNDAPLIFLDEPTNGLDPVNAKQLKDMILEFKKMGKTIFITTHDMYVADALCDRVAFIIDGMILEIGKPNKLKMKYGEREVVLEYIDANTIKQKTFNIETYGKNEAFHSLIRNNKTHTIHSLETTLEDVFIKVTGRRLKE
jgi:fluoroquinolone transport system ATP-binding protein